jgi:hypothetical protein
MDLFDDTCGTCVHYLGAQAQKPDVGQGHCMRYPPIPVPVMQPAPSTVLAPGNHGQPAQGFGVMSVRPPVTADTPACGEHDTPEGAQPAPGGP